MSADRPDAVADVVPMEAGSRNTTAIHGVGASAAPRVPITPSPTPQTAARICASESPRFVKNPPSQDAVTTASGPASNVTMPYAMPISRIDQPQVRTNIVGIHADSPYARIATVDMPRK